MPWNPSWTHGPAAGAAYEGGVAQGQADLDAMLREEALRRSALAQEYNIASQRLNFDRENAQIGYALDREKFDYGKQLDQRNFAADQQARALDQQRWEMAFGREGDWRSQDVAFRDLERGDRLDRMKVEDRRYLDELNRAIARDAAEADWRKEERAFRQQDRESDADYRSRMLRMQEESQRSAQDRWLLERAIESERYEDARTTRSTERAEDRMHDIDMLDRKLGADAISERRRGAAEQERQQREQIKQYTAAADYTMKAAEKSLEVGDHKSAYEGYREAYDMNEQLARLGDPVAEQKAKVAKEQMLVSLNEMRASMKGDASKEAEYVAAWASLLRRNPELVEDARMSPEDLYERRGWLASGANALFGGLGQVKSFNEQALISGLLSGVPTHGVEGPDAAALFSGVPMDSFRAGMSSGWGGEMIQRVRDVLPTEQNNMIAATQMQAQRQLRASRLAQSLGPALQARPDREKILNWIIQQDMYAQHSGNLAQASLFSDPAKAIAEYDRVMGNSRTARVAP